MTKIQSKAQRVAKEVKKSQEWTNIKFAAEMEANCVKMGNVEKANKFNEEISFWKQIAEDKYMFGMQSKTAQVWNEVQKGIFQHYV
jgi:hypothetical protein